MSYTAYCTDCGKSYTMKSNDLEGKKVPCKKCGTRFVVSFNGKSSKKSASKSKKKGVGEASSAVQSMIILGSVVAGGAWLYGMYVGYQYFTSGANVEVVAKVDPANVPMVDGRSKEGKYGIKYPEGWEFETGGGTGGQAEWVRLKTDGITINFRTNLKASAMGDISSGGGTVQDEELPEELEPIASVHEFMKSDMALEMDPYEEEAAEKVQAKSGNSRICRFTGDRGFLNGGRTWGLRATVPIGPDVMKVICTCDSEKQRQENEELLRKVILSIGS